MFADPDAVARYSDGPPRFMPGYHDMQRMAGVLLSERVPDDGKVLVVGAGGGLEIRVFAKANPNWHFWGVDPSAPMIALAAQTLGAYEERVTLITGLIDDAPDLQFDGATCLLTLHFLDETQRLATLTQINRRLKPGAPFVVAHMSISSNPQERALWLARYAGFALASGVDPAMVDMAREKVATQLQILPPEKDIELLRLAGFTDVTPFYHGFSWRGWVSYVS
jgi:tRNA (cmo5U34)-methyltransferase